VTDAIRTDSFFPHPPEKVWRALTNPGLLASWLMPNDFEPRVGHRFTFRTDPVPGHGFDGIVRCEVLELVPARRLRISWAGGGLDTTVTGAALSNAVLAVPCYALASRAISTKPVAAHNQGEYHCQVLG
jgi:uncharacterized protein YndB with AHSA1/START domain